MRKDQLKKDIDYAFWDGRGGFAIPREGWKAENAFKNTLRVRVLDTEAPVQRSAYLIPPNSKGVLFQILDHDGDEKTERTSHDDGQTWVNEPVTRWQPNARNFTMPWNEFIAMIQPLLDAMAEKLGREAFLKSLSGAAEIAIATRLDRKQEDVSVNIHEWPGKKDEEVRQSISATVDFDSVADLTEWLNS